MRRSTAFRLLASGALVLGLPHASAGQGAAGLAQACVSAGGQGSACASAAVAARALGADVGLSAGLGSEVSGTASNLGRRLGMPHLGVGVRYASVWGSAPDPVIGDGAGDRGHRLQSGHVDLTVGLFDGFRLLPTVGGFLAVDLTGRAVLIGTPGGAGFEGGATTAFSLGARVGIFRESFTLPGLSVSASRRFVGSVEVVGVGTAPAGRVGIDPSVTSLRATVGKDVGGVQLLAGIGWDDYGLTVRYEVPDAAGGSTVSGRGSVDDARLLYFVSGSRAFSVVIHVSLEAGLARGFDPVAAYAGAFDATGATPFASFALRLVI